ncbi:hypothetical protein DOY81_014353 [Sarcophaga bullata]|nr:hypothetical protein DOY81_014353 [Sarcophaga bullata]
MTFRKADSRKEFDIKVNWMKCIQQQQQPTDVKTGPQEDPEIKKFGLELSKNYIYRAALIWKERKLTATSRL